MTVLLSSSLPSLILSAMTIFRSPGPPFVPPRNDITLPQFILDDVGAERTRPVRPAHVPCLIDSETGKTVYLDEVRVVFILEYEVADETTFYVASGAQSCFG